MGFSMKISKEMRSTFHKRPFFIKLLVSKNFSQVYSLHFYKPLVWCHEAIDSQLKNTYMFSNGVLRFEPFCINFVHSFTKTILFCAQTTGIFPLNMNMKGRSIFWSHSVLKHCCEVKFLQITWPNFLYVRAKSLYDCINQIHPYWLQM